MTEEAVIVGIEIIIAIEKGAVVILAKLLQILNTPVNFNLF